MPTLAVSIDFLRAGAVLPETADPGDEILHSGLGSFRQPSLTELAYTPCSTASIQSVYINSPSTPK